jgi:predicted transcriptional regulator
MRKDAPVAFRIPADLKKRLQEVAKLEARSISQTCEMFLRLGVEGYEKEGSKFLQRFLARQKKEGSSE